MENYLTLCRSKSTQLTDYNEINIVIGNESCDLDSAVSAMVIAYLHYILQNMSERNDSIIIPLLNIKRSELILKTELLFWFEDVTRIDRSLLICKDEINFEQLKNNNRNIYISLVDHNEDREFETIGQIVEIIDHHQPLRNYNNMPKVTIDPTVGSCCSLVAERYLQNADSVDPTIALLLYGPIVLDTICLSSSANRFNRLDVYAIEKLESVMGSERPSREEVYQQLIEAKNRVSNLSFEQLIEKDLKVLENLSIGKIAVSSVSGNLISNMKLENQLETLKELTVKNSYSALVILGIKNDVPEHVERDIAVYSLNSILLSKICDHFESSNAKLELQLHVNTNTLRIYKQKNITASRKVIIPLLSAIELSDFAKQNLNMIDAERVNEEKKNDLENDKKELENDLENDKKELENDLENDKKQLENENDNRKEIENEREIDNDMNRTPKHRSPKPLITSQISTADVDPEFVLSYQAETADFPESPKYYTITDAHTPAILTSTPVKVLHHKNGSSNAFEGHESGLSPSNNSPLRYNSINNNSCQTNNESIHGSYIEDSFVGELMGDYNADPIDENDSDDTWTMNTVMDNELEFEFDSYGPESMIYAGNIDANHENSVANHENSVAKTQMINDTVQNVPKESDGSVQNGVSPSIEPNETANDVEIILDNNEITCQMTDSDTDTFETPSNFKRNTSLTISQRRKISPKLNFQQILNASDDISNATPDNEHAEHTEHTPTNINPLLLKDTNNENASDNLDGISPLMISKLQLADDDSTRGVLVNQTSVSKKKIPVNRELLANEDISAGVRSERNNPQNQSSASSSNQIPELTAREELYESRIWRDSCPIGPNGEVRPIDMKVIEPYKKVISHGGYYHHSLRDSDSSAPGPALIVFSACYLPDRSRKDYSYVMDHLFLYVLTTLHNLVADDYILIYFHNAGGGTNGNNMPTFGWLKRCYFMIDRRLKKNLRGLYLVHPTFWLKTLIIMTKPFISSKFSRKLRFVNTLSELSDLIPIDHVAIPQPVKQYDDDIVSH